ncbi:Pre-mRNA-splicing factor 38A [Sarcoptes scabiei]|uniref:Pre-mRNA-splicing factor 38 n=1 Tax=Sarcoptes scabiei TaxID=52283 RepID=A0A834RD86_SARSC|nr:Pre-mRNA-splicing factor 38A [Sarcoptes scabiei]UXI15419.1 regulator of nonsense transcripts [Sarcoptes scabiei]
MANKTVKDAKTIHGTNPQYLIEKIIRTRIYESRYWKEECFGLTADLVVDRGADLRYIGGSYGGNIKTTPFLCLILKLLQIQPEKDIIIEFIRQENFKYIRALGAFYLRLVGNSLDIYKYLEPLYNDYRKLRRMTKMGTFDVIYMDEFIDLLLRDDRVFDIILPRLTKRFVHEENGELTTRVSLIQEDLNIDENEDEDRQANQIQDASSDEDEDRGRHKKHRSRSPDRNRSRHHHDRRDSSPHRRHRHRSRRSKSSSPVSRRHRSKSPLRTKKRDRVEKSPEKAKTEADEIAEMNALRAKLGLKPLKI